MKLLNTNFDEIVELENTVKITVTDENGNTLTGDMYGTDEMFNGDEFYQLLITADKVYTCYYAVDDDTEIDCIDYTKPTSVEINTDYAVVK